LIKKKFIKFNIKYINKLNKYKVNKKKVLGMFKLIINFNNINKFNKIYNKNFLNIIIKYFNKIINNKYFEYIIIDEYINIIQSTTLYLKKLNYSIPKFLLICILFKKLFSNFEIFASKKYKKFTKNIKNINII
jgi:hypothetical protein